MAGTDTGTEDKENGDLRVTAETRFKQCSDEENPAGSFKRSFSHRPGRGRRGRSFGLVAALSLILLAVPTLAEEGSTSKETEKKKHTWTGEIETGLIYDSNVFQAKSKIESDLIWESAFSLAYRPRKTRWSGSAVLNRYLQIQELNYSFFEIGGERPFGEKYYGSLFLQFSPPASLDKEDPTLPTIELGSAGFTAQIDRDLTSWWNTGLSVTYNRLDYNADFDAKDTDLVRLGLPQTFRPALSWRLSIDYAVEAGSAKGGAVPIDGEAVREDNASYRAQAGGVQISYRFGSPLTVRLRYRVRQKVFTTDLPEDVEPIHAGRRDTNHLLLIGLRYQPFPKILIRARSEYLWRNSSDSAVEFKETLYAASLAYFF